MKARTPSRRRIHRMNKHIGYGMALAALLMTSTGCGGSSTDNHYGATSSVQNNTITVRTVDQYGNPVDGRIALNGVTIGTQEVQISYTLGQGGTVTFDALEGFTVPQALDLAATPLDYGEIYVGAYQRTGQSANVCPRAINIDWAEIDATVTINGLRVDYLAGYCRSVDVSQDTNIESTGAIGTWANPVYIPAGSLQKGETYNYDLLFGTGGNTIYVATTPVDGEVLLNGRSLGWVKDDDFLSVQLPSEKGLISESLISFGAVSGHETAKAFSVNANDVDQSAKTNHFWALYDASTHALTCFQGMSGGSSTTAKVLVDDSDKLISGWDYPACIGLDVSKTHAAEFLKSDNFQSTDILSISADDHVGCEGEFLPGGTLNCVGEYYYVQPVQERTEFYLQFEFTAPYQGKEDYPISGRFDIAGVQYEQSTYSVNLKLSESMSITYQPVGILSPSISTLTIDTATLSEDDAAYDPKSNNWVYQVAYQPPAGAVETCVRSLNQNDANVSFQLGMKFDGVYALNNYAEDLDCHWFMPAGNHLIVPDWLNGYQPSVSQIYVPDGKVLVQSQFELLLIPQPTQFQICVDNSSVEAAITLNGHHLGWTNLGQKCLWLDKSQPNTLTLEGKGTRSWAADDPSLPGSSLTINYADF